MTGEDPAAARVVVRSGLSGATLTGASLVVVALMVAVGWLGRPGPNPIVGGAPSTFPGGTATPSETSRPTPSDAPVPTAAPSAMPFAIGTPQPGDLATATDLVSRYEAALVAARWQAAWDLLAPEERSHWASYSGFVADRSAYFRSVAGRYTIRAPTHEPATIRQWVVPDNYPAAPIWPASPDYDRAFVVEVDYPLIAQSNAFDVLLAAPDASGHWFIWQLR